MSRRSIGVIDLGRRGYGEILHLQRELCRQRIAREVEEDLLLLVEHDPVITLGRASRAENLHTPKVDLARRGVPVFEVERGGDVTYHGPGQLVGYPILDLQAHRPDLHWYLRQLEAALILGLSRLRIPAERRPGLTGVWTRGRKIASIGIHVRQWVTFHGFALNVLGDLDGFELIVPCGIQGVQMSSVERELGHSSVTSDRWTSARDAVVVAFGETFDREPRMTSEQSLLAHGPMPASAEVRPE